jgi:hypothetical protein
VSSDSRLVTQELALRYVVVPRLRKAIIGSVSYLLIDNYIVASLTSKTHDYRDKVYYLAGALLLRAGRFGATLPLPEGSVPGWTSSPLPQEVGVSI